jgi:hypothetical protein
MSIPAIDRSRIILFSVAVLAAVLGFAALGVVKSAMAVAAKPVPAADVQTLTAFLGPLPDSSSLAGVARGTMVVGRDPFAAMGSLAGPQVRSAGGISSRPRTAGDQQWIVSSILFEDSRRSAIVNNAWVTVGDPLGGGARLTAIERKHVIVTDANGTRHVVPLQGGES